MNSVVCRVVGDFVLFEVAIQEFPTEVRERVLWPVVLFKKARFRKYDAAVCNISLILVVDVFEDSGGVRLKSVLNFIVAAEPVQDIVVDWTQPGDSFSHLFKRAIVHRYQLSTAPLRIFPTIGESESPITGKPLSSNHHIVSTNHAPGSQRVHYAKKPGLPIQREPGVWPNRMQSYNLHRVKRPGVTEVQRRRERCTGLDWNPGRCERSAVTATEQTRTENPPRATSGGVRCV